MRLLENNVYMVIMVKTNKTLASFKKQISVLIHKCVLNVIT